MRLWWIIEWWVLCLVGIFWCYCVIVLCLIVCSWLSSWWYCVVVSLCVCVDWLLFGNVWVWWMVCCLWCLRMRWVKLMWFFGLVCWRSFERMCLVFCCWLCMVYGRLKVRCGIWLWVSLLIGLSCLVYCWLWCGSFVDWWMEV